MKPLPLVLLPILFFLFSCGPGAEQPDRTYIDYYEQLQGQLIDAQPGELIKIPEGHFSFDRPLSLEGIHGVTIRGAGMDKTILSFAGQKIGAEGMRITADSITIENLTVEDAKGDAIKLQDCDGVFLRNVYTTWTGGADESNGAYGLYPVSCQNVLIEACQASFASDAGIYVGQSDHVVVRNCKAFGNVAGIEIENCNFAEVYECEAYDNTGGILVFDLPDLPQVNGQHCRIFRNKVRNNNRTNFAPEGNMVGIIPPGTGIILLAAKRVEIFQNEILGHKTIGLGIASYYLTENDWTNEAYDPFIYDIFIYENTFERKRAIPDISRKFGLMVNSLFPGQPQDILYDGILDENKSGRSNPMNICIQQDGNDIRFAAIDAANDFDNIDTNMDNYRCELPKLKAAGMN